MALPYTFCPDLAAEAPIPARGILSQTLSNERGIEFLLFAFAAAVVATRHVFAGEGPWFLLVVREAEESPVGERGWTRPRGPWRGRGSAH